MKPDGAIQEPVLLLIVRTEPKPVPESVVTFAAFHVIDAQPSLQRLRAGHVEHAEPTARVVHEKPPDQIILIAEAGWNHSARSKQQPRIFYATGAEYDPRRQ